MVAGAIGAVIGAWLVFWPFWVFFLNPEQAADSHMNEELARAHESDRLRPKFEEESEEHVRDREKAARHNEEAARYREEAAKHRISGGFVLASMVFGAVVGSFTAIVVVARLAKPLQPPPNSVKPPPA
jgi:hypothetical protein